jgi:hypothetical protein
MFEEKKMKRLDDATIKKAEAIFKKHKIVATGYGLSRRELRMLERAGLVEKRLMKNKDSGTVIYEWTPISIAEGIIKKA